MRAAATEVTRETRNASRTSGEPISAPISLHGALITNAASGRSRKTTAIKPGKSSDRGT